MIDKVKDFIEKHSSICFHLWKKTSIDPELVEDPRSCVAWSSTFQCKKCKKEEERGGDMWGGYRFKDEELITNN